MIKKPKFVGYALPREVIYDPKFYLPSAIQGKNDYKSSLYLRIPNDVRKSLAIPPNSSSLAGKRHFKVIIVEVAD
jgi:hypothetical protein